MFLYVPLFREEIWRGLKTKATQSIAVVCACAWSSVHWHVPNMLVWYVMVEVCEGAPVAVSGSVLTYRHDLAPCAANVCIGQPYPLLILLCLQVHQELPAVPQPRRKLRASISTIPYHTIPYHTMPCHAMPYHAMPCHTIPYHTIPYHTIPYHTMGVLPST